MSIMHLNCNSLYANFEYVKEYLNKLDVKLNVELRTLKRTFEE